MEQQMKECDTKITQLKDTIGSQELSVDDVRKMERQKVRVEEQLQQKRDVLDGHENALKEAQEKWLKCFQLLQQTVDEYNSKGTSLELIPENAKLAKGQKLEIRLDEERALDGIVEMMGGVDVANVVKPYVQKLTEDYKSEAFNEKERVVELKENIESMESLSEQLAEDIEDIKQKITSCQEESTAEQEKLESEIKSKRRQLELLQTKITTLNDPKGTEATIEKYNAQYKQLQALQLKQDKENTAKKNAVAEEIRNAVEKAQKHQDFVKKAISEMNGYLKKKEEECMKLELLDS
eukprot:scaffold13330_cov205-Alexandrium_tamarense.AAC.19